MFSLAFSERNAYLCFHFLCRGMLCCCSVTKSVQLPVTPWTAACQASLSFTVSWSLLKLMSIESMMVATHLIISRPLLLYPSILPSIRVFLTSRLFPSGGQSTGPSASASVFQEIVALLMCLSIEWRKVLHILTLLQQRYNYIPSSFQNLAISWYSRWSFNILDHRYSQVTDTCTCFKMIEGELRSFLPKWRLESGGNWVDGKAWKQCFNRSVIWLLAKQQCLVIYEWQFYLESDGKIDSVAFFPGMF